jgi:thiosulfate reductase cytochrome b subunit
VKVIEKHSLALRIVHWLNLPFLLLMIWSGLLIYWANDVYPGFFPQWFYNLFGISGHLAEGLAIHFFIGWLFVVNGLIYLAWFFVSGHWRELFPTITTFRLALPTILHDMGLSQVAPPQGKFNAMQRLVYTSVIFLAMIAVLSGFAIYKPVQIGWLTACFGGYKAARFIHFAAMISFCLFILMHVVQVIRAGWNNFRAMVAGFEVQDE